MSGRVVLGCSGQRQYRLWDSEHLCGRETIDYVQRFIGSALSFALRLRKRKRGASQTQTPKKVAISAKPGTGMFCRGYVVRALCRAFCVTLAK